MLYEKIGARTGIRRTRLLTTVWKPKGYVISPAEYFKRTHLSSGIIGSRCAPTPGKAGIHRPGVQGSLLLRVDDRRDTMRWHPRPVLHSPAAAVTFRLRWRHHGALANVRAAFLVSFLDGRGWQRRELHHVDAHLSRYSVLQFRTERSWGQFRDQNLVNFISK